ncbi:MAG TPA: penicillin-binding protein 2 [Nitrospiria bacterium]
MDSWTPSDDTQVIKNRLIFLLAFILLLFAVLIIRAGFLQIIKGGYYQERSESNRVRIVHLHPARGLIYDRTGELIANNAPSFNLYVIKEDIKDKEDLLNRLAELIEVDREDLDRRISRHDNRVPYIPVRLKEGLSLREVARIESHRWELAGVQLEAEPQRNYLHEKLGAHMLGYVGEISPSQLERPENEGILPGTTVGQNGVEKTYDALVRGRVGQKLIEVDARGHEVKTVKMSYPRPGNDIYLTIDLGLQKAAEKALEGKRGTIVAMDPRNGEILALVSQPAFDPNMLSRSLAPSDWKALIEDPGHPLTNRVTQGQYPPGSTFKMVSSSAILESGAATPRTRITCSGGMQFGNRWFRDWKRGGHGSVDFFDSIVQSCDVYYYEKVSEIGIDVLADYGRRFGFGKPTGIELTSEKSGLIPDKEWKRRVKDEAWFPGETASASIGQGYITVTPLQLAQMTNAVAVGGDQFQPHLIKAVRDRESGRLFEFPPTQIGRVNVREETLRLIRKAMVGVVWEEEGTGKAARSTIAKIGGKTGTAQVVGNKPGRDQESLPERLRDHAWFIAFAPADDPTIAVVVLVENGGHGGEAAAPRARMVIEEYLRNDRSQLG